MTLYRANTTKRALPRRKALILAAIMLASFAMPSEPVLAAQSPTSEKAVLTVDITGISTSSGQILIAVFNSQTSYEKDDPISARVITAQPRRLLEIFAQLPLGDYAVKVLHDENSDERMNLSLFGAPTEAYGFSQNARNTFRQPRWDEAKFTLTAKGYTAAIRVQ